MAATTLSGRPRPTAMRQGRRAALVVLLLLALPLWGTEPVGPEIVVTDVIMDDRADVDAAFLADGGRELAAAAGSRLVALLAANPGWRVHPDFLEHPANDLRALEQGRDRIYARGVTTRADIRQTRYWGDRRLWTFTVGLRLEFFDIRSGQVWFGQDATVRVPVETAVELDRGERTRQFTDAFNLALETAAALAGRNYRPGSVEAVATRRMADGLYAVDRGSRHGLPPGATGEMQRGAERWLLRLEEVESAYSLARVTAGSTTEAPPAGLVVRFSGVNGLLALEGPQLAVAGAALPAAGELDECFDVDSATLGQWLHDALVDTRAFNLLPPLLAAGEAPSELSAAFFRAQSVFSAVGDLRHDEIVGHRSLPQVLARLVVTHADLTRAVRLGYEARILRLGLLLEIYDRRTHEVLLSQALEGTRREKHSEQYRQTDLVAAWRELARSTTADLARQAAAAWRPAGRELEVAGVDAKGGILLKGDAVPGERGRLLRPGEVLLDRRGEALARRLAPYGIAELESGRPDPRARLALSDGRTLPQPGDRLLLPAAAPRPGARIRHVEIGGEKVQADWHPGERRVTLWAHQALGASGRFNMLAPAALAAEAAAAEVALAGGEFRAVDLDEILLAEEPQPQVLVDLRVGLGRWERTAGPYKADLVFTTGAELAFFNATGEPLLLFTDGGGSATHIRKKAWTLTEQQVLAEGRVVQGVTEEEYGDRLDACLRVCLEKLGEEIRGGAGR
ncbi:MAG: hypothetical protein Q8O14_13265 [bacterium]|nr:hypothetical protein [bacterium]